MATDVKVIRVPQAKKKTHHRATKLTIPLTVVAGFAPLAWHMHEGWKARGFAGVAREITVGLTGYDADSNTWNIMNMKYSLFPILAGFASHYVANRLGVNRVLARARVPFVRI